MSDGTKDEEADGAAAPDAPAACGLLPRMYRPMRATGAFPTLGASATTLGARTPKDIVADDRGCVQPDTGGMSVRPRIGDIPAAFLPRRMKHLNRNAGGSDAVVVFRYGAANGSFSAGRVATGLVLRPDAPGHGNVEPNEETTYDAYQAALHATCQGWVNGESDD